VPAFDPSHLITYGTGLAISALAYYVKTTSKSQAAELFESVTSQVQKLGDSVLTKIDECKEALHAVALSNASASARHEGLATAHDKLDSRVSRIEEHVFKARSAGE
jgi:hypothetical protein